MTQSPTDPHAARRPIIAIVGRPNVGKSTLFNRYAGRRRALVADIAGLTRDRIAEQVEIGGRSILVVDTAGLDAQADDRLGAAVQAQARSAVEEADAILLVVDGKAGLLPDDESIARTLRRSDKPLAVAINKIDVPEHGVRVHEFHALGLEPMQPISAEHGTGAFDVLETLVAALPAAPQPEPAPEDSAIRIAIVGRPNAGKSSLVNRLAGQERVVVSEVPGTTRDSIDVRIEHRKAGEPDQAFILVDTAGRLHTQDHLMRELAKIRDVVARKIPGAPHEVLLVLDATTGQNAIQQADIFRDEVGVTGIVLTKLDGTAKGGVIIGICDTLGIPVKYVGVGEQVEDLQPFSPASWTSTLTWS